MPQFACAAPVIIFAIKSLWPGASKIVKFLFYVLKNFVVTSIVTPRVLSSSVSSIIYAKWKPVFPYSSDRFSCFLSVPLETSPNLNNKCPVNVDFPESTWPIMTILMFVSVGKQF